jgi:hypothetical protein
MGTAKYDLEFCFHYFEVELPFRFLNFLQADDQGVARKQRAIRKEKEWEKKEEILEKIWFNFGTTGTK